MKRDSRVDIRVPAATKAEWEGYAEELEYPTLSRFIEDAIEFYYKAETRPAMSPIGRTHKEGMEARATKAAKDADAIDFCPNAAMHRKGAYCKTCKKVMQ